MSPQLLSLMREFLDEMEVLMEADEGTVFQLQHLTMLEDLNDMLEEEGYGQS